MAARTRNLPTCRHTDGGWMAPDKYWNNLDWCSNFDFCSLSLSLSLFSLLFLHSLASKIAQPGKLLALPPSRRLGRVDGRARYPRSRAAAGTVLATKQSAAAAASSHYCCLSAATGHFCLRRLDLPPAAGPARGNAVGLVLPSPEARRSETYAASRTTLPRPSSDVAARRRSGAAGLRTGGGGPGGGGGSSGGGLPAESQRRGQPPTAPLSRALRALLQWELPVPPGLVAHEARERFCLPDHPVERDRLEPEGHRR
jgi:hypothetical protein